MTGKIAFIFPGQGAQSVGMGKDLYDNYAEAKAVFDTADRVLDKKISTICFEGPEEDLKQTINTQPAIVTTSLAALAVLQAKTGINPDYTAGHSLGEYCAMKTSGVLSLEDTIHLISKRAEAMSKIKGGSMAAILNLEESKFLECLKEAQKTGYVAVANYNSPSQIVITGEDEAVKKASELMSAAGARRVVPLAVSGAFHSEMMKGASEEFKHTVDKITPNNAEIPVITNVDAEITTNGADFKIKMPKQIYSSVHWTQTIQKMVKEGVDTFVEIGPGKVLAGLNKKIAPETTVYNVFDKDSLENTVEALKGTCLVK
ncbi:MAG: ACP S-malonyltransferase [Clostridiaceae bacterium]|jgi:[acyl-carrier-protein] S-malonyltransferase|nr:ACP S-malonyltransferase [Clostridiaceae bacterium]